MLEHPSHRYITYLCTKSLYSPKGIIVHLMRKGLPVPRDTGSKEYEELKDGIGEVQRTIHLPSRFDPSPGSPTCKKSREHLKNLGVLGAWNGDRFVKAAFNAVDKPQVSRMLQVLLLSPLERTDIAIRCRDRFGLTTDEMNSRVVRAYAHYFWDEEALHTGKWNVVLSDWFAGDTTDLRMSLNAPRSEVGAALALAAANRGVAGSLPEVAMFRYVRDAAFMEFTKTVIGTRPGINQATAMLQLTQVMISTQEQIDARRGGSAELLDELRSIEAEYDQESISSLASLTRPRDHAVIDTVGEEK